MTAEKDGGRKFFIDEQISPEILSALKFQYRNAYEAILELTDNAYDNRMPERPLFIYVNTGTDRLGIHDRGGSGMDEEELKNFFRWGKSEKRHALGRYGFGGKAAIASLASSFRLLTAKEGQKVAFGAAEEHFDERTDELKRIEAEEITHKGGHGFFEIEMTNLKRRVDARHLSEILGSTYRIALFARRLAIQVNGQPVEPLEIPVMKGSVQEFEFETLTGEKVIGWVGRLDPGAKKSKLIKPGMRGYVYGRLIADEIFFNFPDAKTDPGLRNFIGEFNIDSDQLPLLPAKTGFVTDDVRWEYIVERISPILAPHITNLLSEQERQRVPRGDKRAYELAEKIVRYGFLQMREFTQEAVKPKIKKPKGKTKESEPKLKGEEKGQGTSRKRTPKKEGSGEKMRLPMNFTIVSRDLGVDTRSMLTTEGEILRLCICPNFRAYQIARTQGEKGLAFFILETAAFELARKREEGEEELSAGDYWNEANRIFREFTEAAKKGRLL